MLVKIKLFAKKKKKKKKEKSTGGREREVTPAPFAPRNFIFCSV